MAALPPSQMGNGPGIFAPLFPPILEEINERARIADLHQCSPFRMS